MSNQKQVRKEDKNDDVKDRPVEGSPVDQERARKIKEDMDKLLDQIDEVLEENSEKFVKSYIQKGGE